MSIIKSIAAAASGLILVSCGGSGTEVTERSRLAVSACDPRPEVTGHADFSRVNPVTMAVTHWRYSVEAIVHADCTVSGEFEEHLDLPTGVTQVVHASITCVTIDRDGRTAYIGGVVDHTRNTNLLPHVTEGFLTVRDNGEGAGDRPIRPA